MKYLITDIEYDTDGEQVDLPKELKIKIPNDIEDIEEYLRDEISNITGFCHTGFSMTKEESEFDKKNREEARDFDYGMGEKHDNY